MGKFMKYEFKGTYRIVIMIIIITLLVGVGEKIYHLKQHMRREHSEYLIREEIKNLENREFLRSFEETELRNLKDRLEYYLKDEVTLSNHLAQWQMISHRIGILGILIYMIWKFYEDIHGDGAYLLFMAPMDKRIIISAKLSVANIYIFTSMLIFILQDWLGNMYILGDIFKRYLVSPMKLRNHSYSGFEVGSHDIIMVLLVGSSLLLVAYICIMVGKIGIEDETNSWLSFILFILIVLILYTGLIKVFDSTDYYFKLARLSIIRDRYSLYGLDKVINIGWLAGHIVTIIIGLIGSRFLLEKIEV